MSKNIFNTYGLISGSGSGGGTGDVVGPSSSIDNHAVTFDGTTGKIIKDSNVNIQSDNSSLHIKTGVSTDTDIVGPNNLICGLECLRNETLNDFNNVVVGNKILPIIHPSDITNNTLVGTSIGQFANLVQPFINNTIIGYGSGLFLPSLTAPCEENIIIGHNASSNHNLNASHHNIVIGSPGVSQETNTIRLGNTTDHNETFISGIYGNAPSSAQMVIINSDGEMGSQVIPSGDVTGPPSSNNDQIALFSSTTGKVIKDSDVKLYRANNSLKIQTDSPIITGSSNILFGHRILVNNSNTNTNDNVMFGSNMFVTGAVDPSRNISNNVILGRSACQNSVIDTGSFSGNVIIGNSACLSASALLGDNFVFNTAIGNNSGSNWLTGNEEYNICLSNVGVTGDQNTIRIGNDTNHTSCYIAGIDNNMQPNTATSELVAIDGNRLTKGMMPVGEIAFSDFTTPYLRTTPVVGTFYEVTPPAMTLTTNFTAKFSQGTNGRLQYDGISTMYFHVAMSLSAETPTANDTCEFALYKNGVLVPNSNNRLRFRTGSDWITTAQHNVVQLSTGDYLSIFISNLDSTTGVNFGNVNLVAVCC